MGEHSPPRILMSPLWKCLPLRLYHVVSQLSLLSFPICFKLRILRNFLYRVPHHFKIVDIFLVLACSNSVSAMSKGDYIDDDYYYLMLN